MSEFIGSLFSDEQRAKTPSTDWKWSFKDYPTEKKGEQNYIMAKMKLNYNGLTSRICSLLPKDAVDVGFGIDLLSDYLKDIAEKAIADEDEFLIQWCLDIGILKEEENKK